MSNIKLPLKFEPYNEQEVIFLFANIYQELGFKIIHIRTAFPDCIAKDKFNNEVRIEFELLSSNFILHQHPKNECDYIVCWRNDAKIDELKVIELCKYFLDLKPDKNIIKKSNMNIHNVIIEKAYSDNGIPYPELIALFKNFHSDNIKSDNIKNEEGMRVIARLFLWGCEPQAKKGFLKIKKKPPANKLYAVRKNKNLIQLAESFLQLLKDQWNFYNGTYRDII